MTKTRKKKVNPLLCLIDLCDVGHLDCDTKLDRLYLIYQVSEVLDLCRQYGLDPDDFRKVERYLEDYFPVLVEDLRGLSHYAALDLIFKKATDHIDAKAASTAAAKAS